MAKKGEEPVSLLIGRYVSIYTRSRGYFIGEVVADTDDAITVRSPLHGDILVFAQHIEAIFLDAKRPETTPGIPLEVKND